MIQYVCFLRELYTTIFPHIPVNICLILLYIFTSFSKALFQQESVLGGEATSVNKNRYIKIIHVCSELALREEGQKINKYTHEVYQRSVSAVENHKEGAR